jgi:polyphosphate glucokinase
MRTSGSPHTERFNSGPDLTPETLIRRVLKRSSGWTYDVVSVGYPGTVSGNWPIEEPGNLGTGWIGFDFGAAFGKPARVVNDAVMQAVGAYDGGRMLFLGLGTGVGSALVTEHVVVPMELGNLPYGEGETLWTRLGRNGLKAHGMEAWLKVVGQMTRALREAFAADYVVLGGGNAKHVDPLPPHTRRGGNHDAMTGGIRLWEELVEPHDREPPPVWRVVR